MRPAAPAADTRLTYDDFLLFPDDGKRHELIDGVHYVTPAPRVRHQDLVGRLHGEIFLYLREHPAAGRVLLAPLDVVLSNYDIVEPDLLFIAGDQTGIMTEKNIQGAPALVVEVMSKRTRKRDVQIKRRLFERVGVREYWLVDPVHIRQEPTNLYRGSRNSVVLIERRPHYLERFRHPEHPFAKFVYNQRVGSWSLRWRDRNGRWHAYDGFQGKPHFSHVLAEVVADPTAGIFLG